MENDILLSVKPAYAGLLVDGIKTIELRKKFPKELSAGTKIYIYSSYPEKLVIGECSIEKVECLSIEKLWAVAATRAMISWTDFKAYFEGHDFGHAIYVYKAKRYDEPILLNEIKPDIVQAPQSFCYMKKNQRAEITV